MPTGKTKKKIGDTYHAALRTFGQHKGRRVVRYKIYKRADLSGSPVLVGVAYEKDLDRRITEQLELLDAKAD